jgi:hypothetical protein
LLMMYNRFNAAQSISERTRKEVHPKDGEVSVKYEPIPRAPF